MNVNVKDVTPDAKPVAEPPSEAKLRHSSVRGGMAKLVSQVINFSIRMSFIAILSRLIDPTDFGLFTMAVVFIGIFEIFATGGFSQAAVQNKNVTQDQLSYLFLYNFLVSLLVASLCYVASIFMASFYHDPRISTLVLALVPGFMLTSVGAIPVTLLQRQMRFIELACIDVASAVVSSALGVALAFAGYGYWALVASAVAWPATNSIGAWIVSGWVPTLSRHPPGVGGMVKMGATVIINNIVIYFAYNTEKMLLGRFWGPEVLGLYGRANQLSILPGGQLNQAIGPVAFAALARMQDNPERLRRYFLDFFYLMNCVTAPLAAFFFFFASEVIGTILGHRWEGAHEAFRFLAPSVLFLGMMNPPGWLLFALGLQRRSLAIAIAIAPLCITAYFIGLPYGPNGVSAAYSTALGLWLLPHLVWCFHGTPIKLGDIFRSVAPSFVAGLISSAVAFAILSTILVGAAPILRLAAACAIVGPLHFFILLIVLRQRHRFIELWADLRAETKVAS